MARVRKIVRTAQIAATPNLTFNSQTRCRRSPSRPELERKRELLELGSPSRSPHEFNAAFPKPFAWSSQANEGAWAFGRQANRSQTKAHKQTHARPHEFTAALPYPLCGAHKQTKGPGPLTFRSTLTSKRKGLGFWPSGQQTTDRRLTNQPHASPQAKPAGRRRLQLQP